MRLILQRIIGMAVCQVDFLLLPPIQSVILQSSAYSINYRNLVKPENLKENIGLGSMRLYP